MPGMSGIDVLQRLKRGKETSMIPVVMLTAKEESEDRVAGFETGADDYIAKPFEPSILPSFIGFINVVANESLP